MDVQIVESVDRIKKVSRVASEMGNAPDGGFYYKKSAKKKRVIKKKIEHKEAKAIPLNCDFLIMMNGFFEGDAPSEMDMKSLCAKSPLLCSAAGNSVDDERIKRIERIRNFIVDNDLFEGLDEPTDLNGRVHMLQDILEHEEQKGNAGKASFSKRDIQRLAKALKSYDESAMYV